MSAVVALAARLWLGLGLGCIMGYNYNLQGSS